MKKILLTLIMVFLLTSVVGAEDYDFRKVNWGMSVEQVKENEKSQLLDGNDETLMYRVDLNNNEYVLLYGFKNDKLYKTVYILDESFELGTTYVSEYNYFKKLLTEKYGNASGEGKVWIDDTYKDNIKLALYYKDLIYKNKWENNKVEIDTVLSSSNDKIVIFLQYVSKEYKHLQEEQDKEDEEKTKSNL
mgnify:CR=1 FL=1